VLGARGEFIELGNTGEKQDKKNKKLNRERRRNSLGGGLSDHLSRTTGPTLYGPGGKKKKKKKKKPGAECVGKGTSRGGRGERMTRT